MFAPDGVAHGLGDDRRGPEGFKLFHASFRQAFPNVRVQVDDAIAEGDRVAYIKGRSPLAGFIAPSTPSAD
jgi:predicted ester cyclase